MNMAADVARLERIAERAANLVFILINRRAIDVPIADFDRRAHGLVDRFGF